MDQQLLAILPAEFLDHVKPFAGSVVATLALVGLLLVLLPRGERMLVRGPLLAIGLHVLFLVLDELMPHIYGELPFEYVALFFVLCGLGRSLFLLIFRSVISRQLFQAWPRIFFDLIQGLIYAVVLFITLDVSGVPGTSLVVSSTALTVLIGLLMRDSLGNLFAGLAIHAERPFEVGDWIQFDDQPSHIGQVFEINWRATKVMTLDLVELVVPNGQLAQAAITNFTKPHTYSRRSVYFTAPYDVPTRAVQEIVQAALADSWGVLKEPPPSVVTNAFTERGVEYWARFFTAEFGQRDRVDGMARDRIWYALHRQGIAIPGPLRRVQLEHFHRDTAALEEQILLDQRRAALRSMDFLEELPDEAIERLASATQRLFYAADEVVIREEANGQELFIINRGEVVVHKARPDGPPRELGRLGPMNFFGEMSLMTGQPRSATVTAIRDCEVFVVGKRALAPILAASPQLADHISEILAVRQAEQDRYMEEDGQSPEQISERRRDLLQRIRAFFSL